MDIHRTEAIVLKALTYRERDRILTLFSQEEGIISLLVKNISYQKAHLLSLTTSFCIGEFLYRKTKNDLWIFHEGSVLQELGFIRENLSHLQTACSMAKAILSSQLPHKKSPALYELFKRFLCHIPILENSESLQISFLLKLLKHDGLLSLKKNCSLCQKNALFLQKGESLCEQHKQTFSTPFSEAEYSLLFSLQKIQLFSELKTLPTIDGLAKKMERVFTGILE
jgi:DNA repair protein RecO (recombination protein O)